MRAMFLLVAILGCSKAPVDRPITQPEAPAVRPPPVTPAIATITVQMTAATLADDCGGGPNTAPAPPKAAAKAKQDAPYEPTQASKAKRKCEQSSIQLSITAPAGAKPAELAVKQVELFDETGKSLGVLESRAPSLWSEANGYMPWDQKITPGQELSVSYALGRPDWSKVPERWNKTYVVKAQLSIGGADQTVQQNVEVGAPTSLPPNVKT
ncbi:MAG: hypothetical protein ABI867_09105 [Kofleriaceae bacterium]